MGRSAKAEFDFASPEIAGPQFWDAVNRPRDLGPLVWVESSGGFWAAATYDMNLRIAQDWRDFTSAQGVALTRPSFEAMPRLVPIEVDPPRHRGFRRQVNPALTVKAVSPLEDEIRAIADELIDGFTGRGSCDIAVDFARRFPGTGFFRLLVHSSDEGLRTAEQAARRISFESDDKEKFARSASELRAWAGRLFDDHAAGRASGADLAEAVMRLADSGETGLDHERMAGLQILAQGGIGTSASAIGQGRGRPGLPEHAPGRESVRGSRQLAVSRPLSLRRAMVIVMRDTSGPYVRPEVSRILLEPWIRSRESVEPGVPGRTKGGCRAGCERGRTAYPASRLFSPAGP